MNFFGSNCGCQDESFGGGCGCDPCTLILLLMLCGGKSNCDPCQLIWIMLILNCLCGGSRHGSGCCGH